MHQIKRIAFRLRHAGLLAAMLGGAVAFGMLSAPAAATTCFTPGPGGTCLDNIITPKTGQRTDIDNEYAGETPVGFRAPADARSTQHHGVVRLKENAFIDAHNICRYVDNRATEGPGLYLGLESKGEWSSAIGNPPPGAVFTPCCRAVTVEVCGSQQTIPYSKAGTTKTINAGHNRVVTYTCANDITGSVPTSDTSWLVAASGQCQAPSGGGDNGCHMSKGGEKRGENCDPIDPGDDRDHGGHDHPGYNEDRGGRDGDRGGD